MSTSTNIHHITRITAEIGGDHSNVAWLEVKDEKGNAVSIFMPFGQAAAMADAFNAYHDSHFEPQPEAEGVPV